jgi:hypothetical protein
MALLDLVSLCLLPGFRQILSRFSGQIKVDLLSTPAQLFLRPIVTPFILDTHSPTPVLKRLQKTLGTLTATPPD